MEKGCVHVYMGKHWKDLNTALGMALRACGAGFGVGFYSFDNKATEMENLQKRLPGLQVLNSIQEDVSSFDMIILYNSDLADRGILQKFLEKRPQCTEIVLCGTSFADDVPAEASLISEIVTL